MLRIVLNFPEIVGAQSISALNYPDVRPPHPRVVFMFLLLSQ